MKSEEASYQILIADRNPHVRTYLKRELKALGYDILLARSCREVIAHIEGFRHVDALVLDPDLPGADVYDFPRKLTAYLPKIPTVLHTLEVQVKADFDLQADGIVVEKKGNSVEQIQAALHKLLGGRRPPAPACKIS